MKTISFVIPVFRNEGSLKLTYLDIRKQFDQYLTRYNYEIIFVDDGSDDNSLNELLAIKQKDDSRIRIVSFSRNFGQVSAIIAGCREVTGEIAIMMSADLQEPIEMIKNMVEEWENGNEIVICHRQTRHDSAFANVSSAIFYRLINFFNPKIPPGGFDFMLLDRKPITVFNNIDERNRFIQGDIVWLGFKTKFMPYNRLKRTIGKSQWTLPKKINYFMNGIMNTSFTGIRIMSLIGVIITLSGLSYTSYVLYQRFLNKIPISTSSIAMLLILVIGGLTMVMLGIAMEYIWRVYDEARKRPDYIIRKRYD